MSGAGWLYHHHIVILRVIAWTIDTAFTITFAWFACECARAWLRAGKTMQRLADPAPLPGETGERLMSRLGMQGTWPDQCSRPPCELWEDVEVLCNRHMGTGKHHPPPLRYGPPPVVADIAMWEQELDA